MLLFINGGKSNEFDRKQFQYISCYCLSSSAVLLSRPVLLISIHLMLLFIEIGKIKEVFLYEFQYISCYCLSKVNETFVTDLEHFNTSHVIVYRLPSGCQSPKTIFQYISCYCLSKFSKFSNQDCCDFNTSHVIVYQYMRPAV